MAATETRKAFAEADVTLGRGRPSADAVSTANVVCLWLTVRNSMNEKIIKS